MLFTQSFNIIRVSKKKMGRKFEIKQEFCLQGVTE